jgi:GrpB-like predicted nucleotidyltransferase (UPF0157 family)
MKDIDEPVLLVPYDDAWPSRYDGERLRIAAAFGVEPRAGLMQHIGSTAVPGLVGKPVIDIMLGVGSWPPRPEFIARICKLGYENLGEAGIPGRIYLRRRDLNSYNAHVVQRGGEHWTNNLAIRDLLRRDPGSRARYAAAKRAALDAGKGRLLAYSEAKEEAVAELLAAARAAAVK